MWRKKINHKKKQFTLVGIMFGIIAMVLCACTIFLIELNVYADFRFSETYCPDAYVYSLHNISMESNFPKEEVAENIREVAVLDGKSISVPLYFHGENISSITSMFCSLDDEAFLKYITPLEGDVSQKKEPGDGEVWIVSTLASSYNIQIGDTIFVMYDEPVSLRVSGIYSSTYAPSERLTIMVNIVNEATLQHFEYDMDGCVIAVNLKDASEEKVNQLAMGNPSALITMSRAGLKRYITQIGGVVGMVSAAAALIVFIASLLIIRFIINIDIKKEFNSIGIYQSLGYTNKDIISIYTKGYLFVGGISIAIGILLSTVIAYYLCNETTKILGIFGLSKATIFVCIVCFVLLMLILWRGVHSALKKIQNITPVDVLCAGQSSGEFKIGKSVIKQAKSPFETAVNDIFRHKKTSTLTLIILSTTFFLLLFFSASYYSCSRIYEDANIWVACPKFNAIVTGSVSEEISEYVRNRNDAKSAICGNCFYYPAVTLPQYTGNSRNVDFYVFEDTAQDITGVTIKKGKNPELKNEVAISEILLKQLGLEIGDNLIVERGETKVWYEICGSFASMESLTIYMTMDALRQIQPEYVPGMCYIMLKEGTDYVQFKKDLEQKFTGISVDCEWSALRYAMKAIEGMLTNVMMVLLIVFMVFAIVGVINILALTINNKKRQYGIMKALGFKESYIVKQNLWYAMIMNIVSLIIALILHGCLSKSIFAMIVINALSNSLRMNISLLGMIILIILWIIYGISKIASKTTPLSLMEE
jgi:putative ABC transport system permease protein